MLRDQTKTDPEYWQRFLKKNEFYRNEARPRVFEEERTINNRITNAYGAQIDSYSLVLAAYSAGCDLDKIRAAVCDLFVDIDRFYSVAKTVPDYMDGNYRGMYYKFLTYASLAVCFDLEKQRCENLVSFYDLMYDDTRDFFFETMLVTMGFEGRGKTTDIMRPQIFDRLYRVYDSEPALRPGYLQEYVKKWYHSMEQEAFYYSHTSIHDVYYGYWCVEAAATAKILNIDDSALQKNKYYPYEMAHYRDWKLQQKIKQDINNLGGRTQR